MKFNIKVKLFVFAAAFFATVPSFFAQTNSAKEIKLLELAQTASVKKIKSYLMKNKGLVGASYGEKRNSILIEAMNANRDYNVIKLLLDAGASPKAQNADGDTAVSYAAKIEADAKILDALISYDTVLPFQRKNRILKKNNEGLSAMDYAQKKADAEQIKVLEHYLGIVDIAESPSETEPAGETALFQEQESEPEPLQEEEPAKTESPAISAPEDAEALLLAAAAAQARASRPYKRVYLFDGIETYDTYEAEAKKPAEIIAEPDKRDTRGRTLLQKAASEDDIERIIVLKNSGADFNLADNDGYTPLMFAARFAKKIETVALLISCGADAKAKNRYGLTAIEIAADSNKNPNVIEAILAKSRPQDKQKAFITAVGRGRPDGVIKKFFDAGMSPNMIYKGKSALMYAAESNTHTDCIKLLLQNGADKKLLTSDWKDAFWFASQNPSLPKNDVYWSLNNSEKS